MGIESSMADLFTTMLSQGGQTVFYDDGLVPFQLEAIPGVTQIQYQGSEGDIRTGRLHDFIVWIDDMGGRIPKHGDEITWQDRVYAVSTPAGLRHYEEIGPYKQVYRIHTREKNAMF
jgi:hypothetical protein